MSYTLELQGKSKRFNTLRELGSWAAQLMARGVKGFRVKYKGERLDEIDSEVMMKYVLYFQEEQDNV